MTRVNSENHIHIGLILGNKILEIQPKNNLFLSYESNYMTHILRRRDKNRIIRLLKVNLPVIFQFDLNLTFYHLTYLRKTYFCEYRH